MGIEARPLLGSPTAHWGLMQDRAIIERHAQAKRPRVYVPNGGGTYHSVTPAAHFVSLKDVTKAFAISECS
jgi:hypothetical protein